jgi:hypothetical protein
MPAYVVYGIRLDSALALPELAGSGGEATGVPAVVRRARIEGRPGDVRPVGARFAPPGGGIGFYWPRIGALVVREGMEILVDPDPGADEAALRPLLLGPAMAVLLHQRGRLILHASAVRMPGGAVAFAGDSGGGKSTTAAALHARGLDLVTDDLLVLDPDAAGGVVVYPGFPVLRLWPEAAAAVTLGEGAGVPPGSGSAKLAWPARPAATGAPLPLARAYVLRQGALTAVEKLPAQTALLELLRHAYCASLVDDSRLPAHFLQCARVVRQVPVYRLARPRSLAALTAVVALVQDSTKSLAR